MPGKKIIFLNHWALNLGGAELSLLDILKEAVKRNDVHLLSSETGPLIDSASELGVSCRVIPCNSSLLNVRRKHLLLSIIIQWKGLVSFCAFLLKVRAIVRTINPDLIHANVPKSHIALFFLKMLGYHGLCCFHLREIFKPRSLPLMLYSVLYPGKNAFSIAISEAVKLSLPRRLQATAAVVYNGIPIPGLTAAHNNRELRFIYLGRIVPWKGCHLLIEAFAKLLARSTLPCSLSIVGGSLYWDDSYRKQLESLITLRHVSGSCRLLQHTADPYKTLMDHDVLCLASDHEPFGRVAAEAHACGLPVICFDNGGLKEIVLDGITGFLVPYGDLELFTNAMERFLIDRHCVATMGRAGQKRAADLFNRDIQMPKIVAVLEDAILKTT
jgi:glycosyltransferase involved in cell wall biosynthesis